MPSVNSSPYVYVVRELGLGDTDPGYRVGIVLDDVPVYSHLYRSEKEAEAAKARVLTALCSHPAKTPRGGW